MKKNYQEVLGYKTLIPSIQLFKTHLMALGRADDTIRAYIRDLNRLAGIIGDLNLNEIDIHQIELGLNIIKKNSERGHFYSESTMNRIKSAYRSFFLWAYHNHFIQKDLSIYIRRSGKSRNPTLPFTKAEIDILLDTIDMSGDMNTLRDMTMFSIYAFTGIRKSELLQLKVSDFDWFSSELLIRSNKGGISRLQPAPERLSRILSEYIRKLSSDARSLNTRGYLFPGQKHDLPLSSRQVNKRFIKWKEKSGIRKGLTVHSFRSGYATALYRECNDILVVSQALGHRDIRSTEKYIDMGSINIKGLINNCFC